MDILTERWIVVRPLAGGSPQRINMQELLCGPQQWHLALSRDDMELATTQLLIALAQVLWMPENRADYLAREKQPLSIAEFNAAVARYQHTFQLDHPEFPFMQHASVTAKEVTGMDKLLPGVTGSTNCAFINEPGQGDALCSGCTAIALFNQASNAPGFGGGFKSGLRSSAPITTLIAGDDLRSTIWLNVLTADRLTELLPNWRDLQAQKPVWQQPIVANEKIHVSKTGLLRGLFWQPAHIKLCPPVGAGICCSCGLPSSERYSGFWKEKFNFNVEGTWPHPHSPRLQLEKKGQIEEKFLAFTLPVPTWTLLPKIITAYTTGKGKEHYFPAPVIQQYQKFKPRAPLNLIVGGYRNNQATILERRYESFSFQRDWDADPELLREIVSYALEYRQALYFAMRNFSSGAEKEKVKGAGVELQQRAVERYFHHSRHFMLSLLSRLNNEQGAEMLDELQAFLQDCCRRIFNEMTEPFSHHPKLVMAIIYARLNLNKALAKLKPQEGKEDVTR